MNLLKNVICYICISMFYASFSYGMVEDEEHLSDFTPHGRMVNYLNQQPSPYSIREVSFTYRPKGWWGKLPSLAEQDRLAFNVVRIEANHKEEKTGQTEEPVNDFIEVGTGFFLETDTHEVNEALKRVLNCSGSPVLFTCRHCIEEYESSPDNNGIITKDTIESYLLVLHYVCLSRQPGSGHKFTQLEITLRNGSTQSSKVPWQRPSGETMTDMAYLPMGELVLKGKEFLDRENEGYKHYPFFRPVTRSDLNPNRYRFGYLSDVVMYGHPYELCDENRMPLVRFGHCSSDPNYGTEGSANTFYVDMATISGSSGSPIWFYRKKLEGRIVNNQITAEGSLNHDEIEDDDGELRVEDSTLSIEAELDDDEVEVIEEYEFIFAGMVYGGPEAAGDPDIHLGNVVNAKAILSFLGINPTEPPRRTIRLREKRRN